MKKIFASIVVCERILNEVDGVSSAIRIADAFSLQFIGQKPSQEIPAVPLSALVSIRLLEYDELDHSTQIILIRPNGEETPLSDPIIGKIIQRIPNVPGGLNYAIQIGVMAKQWGLHRFKVLFDGEEIAETIFTLREIEEWANSENPPNLIEQSSA
jgi:hypothetical protein